MAQRSTPVSRALRSLAWLGIIIGLLTGLLTYGVIANGASWAPKLALDLEGGTQIILSPVVEAGVSVSQEQLDQAVSIIRQRVDATGVSEAEINTQGGQNIVVSIPGTPDEETLRRIEASAQLEFRAVLLTDVVTTSSVGGSDTTAPTDPATDPAAGAAASTPTTTPTDGSDPAWITPELQSRFGAYECRDQSAGVAPANEPLLACDPGGAYKYLLGPVEVSGATIADATATPEVTRSGVQTGGWAVNIVFNGEGTGQFAAVTKRLFPLEPPRNQFGIVLDGVVISAPSTNAVITDGKPQITGSFSQESAQTLANQLKFGALPFSFTVQSQETISATLGSSQLQSGIIAGLIGLILVMIYTLFQYRLLGVVTITSLAVAAVLTYLIIAILSWRQGYRLSLAGVAGLIVAIGFTADSFIVYFERVRDELRDGRGLESAVEAGWKRALRTIYASKATNLLAAVVLYVIAVGNVRGFALTLGITTVIDVLVVVLFTHPMLQLAAQTRFFSSGHPLSGLDPRALGAVYRGRAQFRTPTAVPAAKAASSAGEAARRQTIAERKAAQLSADTKSRGKDS